MASRRSVIAVLVVAVIGAVFALEAPPAAAQDGEQQTIFQNRMRYNAEDNTRIPAEAVVLSVEDADGNLIGEATSDAEGNWEVPVPGAGEYTVTVDEASLPDGVVLAEATTNPLSVVVEPDKSKPVIIALDSGVGGVTKQPAWEKAAQLTVEGIKLGLFLAMAAIGLSLIFGTTGLVNFAHSEMVTWGMLVAYFFNFYGLAGFIGWFADLPPPLGGGVHLIFAATLAVIVGGLTGGLLDAGIFAPLRRRGSSLISQLVITIGLSILARYIFLFIFGGNNKFFRDYSAQTAIDVGPVAITPKDLVNVILAIIVLGGVGLLLQKTRIGKAMRAVADNRDLAESSGIDVQRVIRIVWIVGGALAALGGVFIGMADQVSWQIGFRNLLLIFAGVTLGGLGTSYGALVGCLVVGVAIQLSTMIIPVELKNVGALVALVLVLLVRPQGILGKAERIG